MTNFHVNFKTGETSRCRAKTPDSCPFTKVGKEMGLDNVHFADEFSAKGNYEKTISKLRTKLLRSKRDFSSIQEKLQKEAKTLEEMKKNYLNYPYDRIAKLSLIEIKNKEAAVDRYRLSTRKAIEKNQIAAARLEVFNIPVDENQIIDVNELSDVKESNVHYTTHSKAIGFGKEEFKKEELEAFSAWSGLTAEQVEEINNKYDPSVHGSKQEYMVQAFKDNVDLDKDFVFVDLETTGFTPSSGEIIEIGIVKYSNDGTFKQMYTSRFDIENSEMRDYVGLGASNIHGIYPKDVKGKDTFSQALPRFEDLLNDENSILVAHNANFEKSWLSAYSKDFRDNHDDLSAASLSKNHNLRKEKLPVKQPMAILDTKNLAMFFLPEGSKTNLSNFSEVNGVPYENAHNAQADAEMTAKAFFNFRNKLLGRDS